MAHAAIIHVAVADMNATYDAYVAAEAETFHDTISFTTIADPHILGPKEPVGPQGPICPQGPMGPQGFTQGSHGFPPWDPMGPNPKIHPKI